MKTLLSVSLLLMFRIINAQVVETIDHDYTTTFTDARPIFGTNAQYPDIIIPCLDGKVKLCIYDTALGKYSQPAIIDSIISDECNFIDDIIPIDVNNDGLQDYLTTVWNVWDECKQVNLFLNNGDTTFTKSQTLSNDERLDHYYIKDLDDDEDIDLIGAFYWQDEYETIYNGTTIKLFLNEGGYLSEQPHIYYSHTISYNQPYLVDYDNDGDDDIFQWDWEKDSILFFENLGDLSFSSVQTIIKIDSSKGFTFLDYDDDDYSDIVYMNYFTDSIYLIKNNLGSFDAPVLIHGGLPGIDLHGVFVYDYDRDGRSEMFASSYENLYYVYNDPVHKLNGEWRLIPLNDNTYFDGLYFFDIENDTITDIVWNSVDDIFLLRNFQIDTTYIPSGIENIGDVSGINSLTVYPNPNTGTFQLSTPRLYYNSGDEGYQLSIIALDGRYSDFKIYNMSHGILEIHLSDCIPGIYQCVLQTSSKVYSVKVFCTCN